MPGYLKDIERLKNPENIHEAIYASSPYVLMKAFEQDPTVKRVIKAGSKIVPVILEEIEKNGLNLHEITLSCFAYILQKVDIESAVQCLEKPFSLAIEKPGPFFVHMAAHTLRQGFKLTIKPLEVVYSRTELLEILEHMKRVKQKQIGKGGKNG